LDPLLVSQEQSKQPSGSFNDFREFELTAKALWANAILISAGEADPAF